MHEMIKIKNLFFSYTGAAPYLLHDVNLTVQDGDYISILGENGCGKSTLMRLILGFIRPDSGTMSSSARRIGYVPQRRSLTESGFPITVEEMLDSYRHLLRLRNPSCIEEALDHVGMLPFRHALMETLSGGQYQKVIMARALMGSPDLLILDEPSTGIDIRSQRDIYHLLTVLNREEHITIISVEHNLEAAIANSTLIYHLSSGRGHLCTPEKYMEEFTKMPETEENENA